RSRGGRPDDAKTLANPRAERVHERAGGAAGTEAYLGAVRHEPDGVTGDCEDGGIGSSGLGHSILSLARWGPQSTRRAVGALLSRPENLRRFERNGSARVIGDHARRPVAQRSGR